MCKVLICIKIILISVSCTFHGPRSISVCLTGNWDQIQTNNFSQSNRCFLLSLFFSVRLIANDRNQQFTNIRLIEADHVADTQSAWFDSDHIWDKWILCAKLTKEITFWFYTSHCLVHWLKGFSPICVCGYI